MDNRPEYRGRIDRRSRIHGDFPWYATWSHRRRFRTGGSYFRHDRGHRRTPRISASDDWSTSGNTGLFHRGQLSSQLAMSTFALPAAITPAPVYLTQIVSGAREIGVGRSPTQVHGMQPQPAHNRRGAARTGGRLPLPRAQERRSDFLHLSDEPAKSETLVFCLQQPCARMLKKPAPVAPDYCRNPTELRAPQQRNTVSCGTTAATRACALRH